MVRFIKVLVFAFAIMTTGSAFADNDLKISGKVKSIDAQVMSFVIIDDATGNDVIVGVNPATDFEAKRKNNQIFSWDRDVEFGYLQAGDWVKIEYIGRGPNIVAEEVDIYR